MAPDPSESFRELRPFCLKLSKELSQQNIKDLESKLGIAEPTHLTQLVEYVLFPLKLALQSENSSSEVKESAVGCIDTLVRRAHVGQLATLEDIFNHISMLLSSKESPGRLANISEELKLCSVNCLSGLLENTSIVVKGAFYSPRFLPALGHTVSILLALSAGEKSRDLKLSAIGCLSTLACCGGHVSWEPDRGDSITVQDAARDELLNAMRDSVAHAFASFIPGISMALCRIVTGDPKLGHAVLTRAVDVWGDIVSLVMNDKHMPVQPLNNEDVISQLVSMATKGKMGGSCEVGFKRESAPESNQEHDKLKSLRVNRTIEWFYDTGSKLKILIERLGVISAHPNWKVRLSLAKFSDKLLENCVGSLQACVSALVDLLVGFSRDEYSQVSSFSRMVLQRFSQRLESGPNSLSSLFEENLHSLLTALPRLMRTADDDKKTQTLNAVVGYMSLLGKSLTKLLQSSSHLKRLSMALVQVLELDLADVSIVEERTPSSAESAVPPSETQGQNPLSYPSSQFITSKYPKYHFKHFTSEKVRVAVNQVCRLLGYHGNISLLADHFLDLFHESKVYQKQVVYILSEVVLGSSGYGLDKELDHLSGTHTDSTIQDEGKDLQEIQKVVDLLITEYTADANWDLVTSNPPALATSPVTDPQDFLLVKNITKQTQGLPFEVLNSNVQLSCLFLEALGIFARVIGTKFEGYLMQVLYPVMAKLGDDNAAVSRSAYGTLVVFCQSCGYVSVDEVIARNADYLVNSISLDFKYVFMNQQAPRVLQVMIQYSNADILSIIEDTLTEVFSVIDLYPDELMHPLMKVLNVLVQVIQRWFPTSIKTTSNKTTVEENSLQQADVHHNGMPAEPEKEESELSSEDIRQFFLDYHRRKQQSMGLLDETSDAGGEGPGNESTETDGGVEEGSFEPDKKVEVPQHVKYVTQVLEKCVHFLSSKSPWLRLLVLDTIEIGVTAICQSEDELLPRIHLLWPPIVKRFTGDEQVVTIKAVDVLCTLAKASGSFMRRRVIKDALPLLARFLDKQAAVSLTAGPAYRQSQSFKLQRAILRGLGQLCRQLEIGEADLSHVVVLCAQYLSCRQPKELQEVAVGAFEDFASVEADSIWLSLNDLYSPQELVPPCAMFKPVHLAGVGPHGMEYAENVKTLLANI